MRLQLTFTYPLPAWLSATVVTTRETEPRQIPTGTFLEEKPVMTLDLDVIARAEFFSQSEYLAS